MSHLYRSLNVIYWCSRSCGNFILIYRNIWPVKILLMANITILKVFRYIFWWYCQVYLLILIWNFWRKTICLNGLKRLINELFFYHFLTFNIWFAFYRFNRKYILMSSKRYCISFFKWIWSLERRLNVFLRMIDMLLLKYIIFFKDERLMLRRN